MEQGNACKDLGVTLRSKGRKDKEIRNVMQYIRNSYLKKEIQSLQNLQLLTYGTENWLLTDRQEGRLQATETRYSRKVAGVIKLDKIKNNNIRTIHKIKPLREKKLKCAPNQNKQ